MLCWLRKEGWKGGRKEGREGGSEGGRDSANHQGVVRDTRVTPILPKAHSGHRGPTCRDTLSSLVLSSAPHHRHRTSALRPTCFLPHRAPLRIALLGSRKPCSWKSHWPWLGLRSSVIRQEESKAEGDVGMSARAHTCSHTHSSHGHVCTSHANPPVHTHL